MGGDWISIIHWTQVGVGQWVPPPLLFLHLIVPLAKFRHAHDFFCKKVSVTPIFELGSDSIERNYISAFIGSIYFIFDQIPGHKLKSIIEYI